MVRPAARPVVLQWQEQAAQAQGNQATPGNQAPAGNMGNVVGNQPALPRRGAAPAATGRSGVGFNQGSADHADLLHRIPQDRSNCRLQRDCQ